MSRTPGDRILTGTPVNYANGANLPFDLSFLSQTPPAAGACSPASVEGPGGLAVREIGVFWQLPYSVAAGETSLSRNYCNVGQNWFLSDNYGDRTNLQNGGGAQEIMQRHTQRGAVVYTEGVDNSGGGAPATGTATFRTVLYRENPYFTNPEETRILVRDLLPNGKMAVQCATGGVLGSTAGNRMTITGGTGTPYAVVIDEGPHPAPKQRVRNMTIAISEADRAYPLPRNVRLITWDQFLGSVAWQKATPDEWASQTITSNSVPMQLIQDQLLTALSDNRIALWDSADDMRFLDPQIAVNPPGNGVIIPIYNAGDKFSLGDCPLLSALHWRTSLAFPSGTFTSANFPQHVITFVDNREGPQQPGGCGDGSGYNVLTRNGLLVPAHIMGDLAAKLPIFKAKL